ncbi:MAG TPA: SCO family protein [Chitinivibrionales bacterium]|nr:SCO family protein [Chitinivibrionales bacterium]
MMKPVVKSSLRIKRLAIALLVAAIAFASPVMAHGGHVHKAPDSNVVLKDSLIHLDTVEKSPLSGTMGFEEKPGGMVPLDVPFIDEAGDTVRLKDVMQGPTVLSLLYYRCPDACGLLLTGIARVLGAMGDTSGTAPNVVTISIDETETPADAAKAKTIALESLQRPLSKTRWHFLTGAGPSIKRVTNAVGFRFVKKGNEFDHPLGLVVLSPQGKVVRYIMGTDFLPMDITLSLMQASSGAVQPTIARVLRACFSYDPKSHRFVFNVLQVSATVVFLIVAMFVAYLIASGRKRAAKGPR